MSWQDRVRQGAYTSPSGLRFPFSSEDVEVEFDKLGSEFKFSGKLGTLVQDRGLSGRRFPLKLYLHGDNYDQIADAFIEAIKEKGIGILEHPIYGVAKVVPLGTIKREDRLRSAGNQAIFDITFVESLGRVYPRANVDAASLSQQKLDAFYTSAADSFGSTIVLPTAIERVSLQNSITSRVETLSTDLQNLTFDDLLGTRSVQAKVRAVLGDLDYLIGRPVTLAYQTLNLLAEPSLLLQKVEARLRGYYAVLENMLNFDFTPSIDGRSDNDYYYQDLLITGVLSSVVVTSFNKDYTTRTSAQVAALDMLTAWEAYLAWKDAQLLALSLLDTGEAQQALLDLLAAAVGALIDRSFDLRTEVIITLDAARTPIDLCAEFYGNVEQDLDFFIESNNLTGDQLLLLERGDDVVYYV